eukprot:m.62642 g.62642  ORF g.62642 m.62642 type:complete len:1606 (+) comp11525_c0_seq1:86-4903(+)
MAKLLKATKKGDLAAVVSLLQDGQDVNYVNKHGYTPLMYASYYGHKEIVTTLLGVKGIKVNHACCSQKGDTALIWASLNGHNEVVMTLVGVEGIDVNQVNNDGASSLSYAVGDACIRKLISKMDKKLILQEFFSKRQPRSCSWYLNHPPSKAWKPFLLEFVTESQELANNHSQTLCFELSFVNTDSQPESWERIFQYAVDIDDEELVFAFVYHSSIDTKPWRYKESVPSRLKTVMTQAEVCRARPSVPVDCSKIVLMGHQFSGKSTLALALQSDKRKVEVGVQDRTLGIEVSDLVLQYRDLDLGSLVPSWLYSKRMRCSVWDPAGQAEFHSSHEVLLLEDNVIPLLLVPLNLSREKMSLYAKHWLRMLLTTIRGQRTLLASSPTTVILVCTKTDTLQGQSALTSNWHLELFKELHTWLQSYSAQLQLYKKPVAINCTLPASRPIQTLRSIIGEIHERVIHGQKLSREAAAIRNLVSALRQSLKMTDPAVRRKVPLITKTEVCEMLKVGDQIDQAKNCSWALLLESKKTMLRGNTMYILPEALDLHLRQLHLLGEIIYKPESGLGETIIVDISWFPHNIVPCLYADCISQPEGNESGKDEDEDEEIPRGDPFITRDTIVEYFKKNQVFGDRNPAQETENMLMMMEALGFCVPCDSARSQFLVPAKLKDCLDTLVTENDQRSNRWQHPYAHNSNLEIVVIGRRIMCASDTKNCICSISTCFPRLQVALWRLLNERFSEHLGGNAPTEDHILIGRHSLLARTPYLPHVTVYVKLDHNKTAPHVNVLAHCQVLPKAYDAIADFLHSILSTIQSMLKPVFCKMRTYVLDVPSLEDIVLGVQMKDRRETIKPIMNPKLNIFHLQKVKASFAESDLIEKRDSKDFLSDGSNMVASDFLFGRKQMAQPTFSLEGDSYVMSGAPESITYFAFSDLDDDSIVPQTESFTSEKKTIEIPRHLDGTPKHKKILFQTYDTSLRQRMCSDVLCIELSHALHPPKIFPNSDTVIHASRIEIQLYHPYVASATLHYNKRLLNSTTDHGFLEGRMVTLDATPGETNTTWIVEAKAQHQDLSSPVLTAYYTLIPPVTNSVDLFLPSIILSRHKRLVELHAGSFKTERYTLRYSLDECVTSDSLPYSKPLNFDQLFQDGKTTVTVHAALFSVSLNEQCSCTASATVKKCDLQTEMEASFLTFRESIETTLEKIQLHVQSCDTSQNTIEELRNLISECSKQQQLMGTNMTKHDLKMLDSFQITVLKLNEIIASIKTLELAEDDRNQLNQDTMKQFRELIQDIPNQVEQNIEDTVNEQSVAIMKEIQSIFTRQKDIFENKSSVVQEILNSIKVSGDDQKKFVTQLIRNPLPRRISISMITSLKDIEHSTFVKRKVRELKRITKYKEYYRLIFICEFGEECEEECDQAHKKSRDNYGYKVSIDGKHAASFRKFKWILVFALRAGVAIAMPPLAATGLPVLSQVKDKLTDSKLKNFIGDGPASTFTTEKQIEWITDKISEGGEQILDELDKIEGDIDITTENPVWFEGRVSEGEEYKLLKQMASKLKQNSESELDYDVFTHLFPAYNTETKQLVHLCKNHIHADYKKFIPLVDLGKSNAKKKTQMTAI